MDMSDARNQAIRLWDVGEEYQATELIDDFIQKIQDESDEEIPSFITVAITKDELLAIINSYITNGYTKE